MRVHIAAAVLSAGRTPSSKGISGTKAVDTLRKEGWCLPGKKKNEMGCGQHGDVITKPESVQSEAPSETD